MRVIDALRVFGLAASLMLCAGCGEMRTDGQDAESLREDRISVDPNLAPRQLTLPKGAATVAQGSGDLSFKAPGDGQIFVFDQSDDAVIGARHVRAGQRFVLSPKHGQATLDDRPVMNQNIKDQHTFRVYFEKE